MYIAMPVVGFYIVLEKNSLFFILVFSIRDFPNIHDDIMQKIMINVVPYSICRMHRINTEPLEARICTSIAAALFKAKSHIFSGI